MTALTKSYFHRGGETPLLGNTIAEHFNNIAERFANREAVVSVPQGCRLDYQQLKTRVDCIAKALLARGFNKGDRVGIWSTNNIEWLLLQLATARVGVILVNINPAYGIKELAYALKRSEIQGIFTIPGYSKSDYVAMLLELLPELRNTSPNGFHNVDFPQLRTVVIYEPVAPLATKRPCNGFMTWPDFLAMADRVSDAELEQTTASLDMDDAINIQYTSGTTGFPKAVVLTHHNILNNAWFTAQAMRFNEQDRLCVPVPFYHCFGMVLANLLCISVGACIVIPAEHFDPLAVLSCVEAESCTALHGVPTMFIAELECPEFSKFDLSSLRTGIMAGAPCPPALMKRIIDNMHCNEILIGYGETEASPLTHLTTTDDSLERRLYSVGRNLPHQEVKIVDIDSREIVPMGQTGEICFRGYHIMEGYYADPAATADVLDAHGWLASGDLGTMDQAGYVQITGRRKEMIIRGGENIYPREIEDHIFTHPKVAEVAVFGIPDGYYGEEIMAWIQPHEGQLLEEQEIRDFCRGSIAHFKIPKYICFVDEFPMTVTGKLQKFKMREIALQKLSGDIP
jgi:fatty-acyl-CoA synthase